MAGGGRKIAVGLSGGVDSAVSLILLKKQGWKPVGVSLRLETWKNKCNRTRENACCTKESLGNARRVCRKLGVPHSIYDVRKEFRREVMDYFVSELAVGRTPNPCLVCNRRLKIKKLLGWAQMRGIRHVATGHYANISRGGLSRAADMKKDQTYGLCLLPKEWLSRLVLPLGALSKEQVYGIATENGLGFYRGVRQSQDLCFVSERAMKPFLFEKLGKHPGPILDEEGKRIGEHHGLFLYTIGQRKGLGLPFANFVKGFDVKRNALLVTRDRSHVLGKRFMAERFNWLSKPSAKSFRALAQIRTHQKGIPAKITKQGKNLLVECRDPIEGIAPGQICALYSGKICLGGGPIMKAA